MKGIFENSESDIIYIRIVYVSVMKNKQVLKRLIHWKYFC